MKYHYATKHWLARLCFAILLLLGLRLPGGAQTISRVAGDGTTTGTGSSVGFPQGIAFDAAGNLYIAGGTAHVIRRLDTSGTYTTLAGMAGTAGNTGDGGPAAAATLATPTDLAIYNGELYFTQVNAGNYYVRKINLASGIISRVAGDGTTTGSGSSVGFPQGIAFDAAGNLYIAGGTAHVIRKLDTSGNYTTLAGMAGTAGNTGDGGPAAAATLATPTDLAIYNGELYFTQVNAGNYYVRKINLASGIISRVAGDGTTTGTGSSVGFSTSVLVDGLGNVFVAGGTAHVIRKLDTSGNYITLAGTAGAAGNTGDGGPAAAATLATPTDLASFGTDLYFTQVNAGNYYIRKITTALAAASTTVTSITTTTPSPTNASSITYTVTFAAGVTGLTSSNFSLSPTVAGASIGTVAAVSGSNNTQYTVTVNTGTGNGPLQLNLSTDAGLTPGLSNDPYAGPTSTIDKTAPTAAISSSAGGNGGTTGTSPIPFTITFSESVTGFTAGDVTVSGGTLSGFSGSGTTYTFNITPSGSGSTVTVNVAAGVANDAAGNGNTAATQFSLTYQQPLVANSQPVTVQLDASGNGTLNASSVNNGSTGGGTLTYTIQKIVYGRVAENNTLTLTTPSGANFTAIRFASYGTPLNDANGNYRLGSCHATNSVATATNSYVGRSTGSMDATNGSSVNNNPTLGDPCSGTPKALAVQAAYSADAASLTYNCTEAGKTQYVLLTVSNGTTTSTSVAQVTVNAPPTATISSVSPTTAQRGATVTVTGTNLSGVNSVTVNGATATVSGLSASGFTFVVPTGATFGAGNLTITAPCGQTLTTTFNVSPPALTATVSTTSASPTSTAPIPFSVSFSQSVGTTFTASDVTVTGGTVTGFSGSGAGPYTVSVTPSGTGTVTVSLAAGVANDVNNTQNSASNSVSVQYNQPVTAQPNLTAPFNNSYVRTNQPEYRGTTVPGAYIFIYRATGSGSFVLADTTIANGLGNFHKFSSTVLADGTYRAYVTATANGLATSANSNTNTFTVDTTPPTVTLSSSTVANGGATSTSPVNFTATFSEPVTNFTSIGILVSGGTVTSGPTAGSGNTYTFQVTPSGAGTVVVQILPGAAKDQAGNNNSSSTAYSFTYQLPTVTVTAVTGTTPSPTATTRVSYTVTFSASVAGLTVSNFNLTTTGSISGASVFSVAGSGNTYTVVVNTGTGDGTLRLNVNNSTGVTPTISNVPYTSGTTYTITKSFAAAPTLRIQAAGSASGNGDVTAFVDVVQVLNASNGSTVANGLQNGSFETNNVPSSNFKKTPDGVIATPWSFTGLAGVSRNGSAFGSTAYSGDAVALVQSAGDNNASLSQNLTVPTGSYQVNFQTIQRNYTALDQRLNVFVNDVFVGSIQPNNIPTYDTFTSATFSVTAPALTATVSTTSASPTSTAPIPFVVSFSQSVGTTFTASDVTVAGGTVTSGSFSGSGAGPYTFTVTPSGGTVSVSLAANVANDANNTGNSASNSVSVQFQPTITVAPTASTLPGGTRGTAYSVTFTASGGVSPYTYAITTGALPAGLTLSSAGVLSGTPTTNGSFTFTVTATDASTAPGPYSGSRSYTLAIAAPSIVVSPTTLPDGMVGVAYSQTLTAAGGTAPYTYAITAGALPAGLTLSSAGVLSGTPTGGTSTFTVTATDASTGPGPFTGARGYTVTINAPSIVVAPTSLPGGTVAAAYSQTLTASGGTAPYTYTISAGALPAGLTLSSAGVLSGTPTAGGSFTFTVTATDGSTGAGPYSGAQSYALTIAAPTIVVSPTSLPAGTQGTAYSQALTASGGTAPYSFAITAGALPAGLTLASNGTLSGTPTTNGSFTFTVTATDASTGAGPYSGARSYTLTIAAPAVTAVGWTGANSTDWFTASNWSPNQVPDATIDVIIPTSPSGNRFPIIAANASQANARNVSIASGASLAMSGNTLTIAANLTNNGTFQPTGGTVVLGNTTLSSILGSGTVRFWNLTVGSNGAQQSTSASTSVQRVLTLNGSFATQNNPFTLESNASGTAMVVNNGTAVISGPATFQRYINTTGNAGLGYRHSSAPTANATVASLATSSFTPVVNPAYNTATQPGTVVPFPTVYGYDQSRLASVTNNLQAFDKGWFSPSSTSDALTVGQGYTVNLTAGQTVGFTGPQNNAPTQPITLNLSRNASGSANYSDAGWQLLGNPFPSPLDYSSVVAADRTGLDAAIYVFESAGQYTGSYRASLNGVGGSSLLAMAQGFFVRVSDGQTSGTLNFRNSQRLTSYANPSFQRTAETRPLVQLTLQGAGSPLADDAYVYFENGATDGFEQTYDAVKLPNSTGLNLSASNSGKQLAIDGHAVLGTAQRVVPLAVGVPAAGSYTLTAAQLLNLSTVPTYLRDLQTGALIDLAQQPSYLFTVSNAAALITGRFELVFSPQQVLATAPAALAQQVALYPNPATTSAWLELPTSLGRQAITATLLDAVGREVRTLTLPAQGTVAHQLDLHQLATGVYALRLSTSAGVVVKKLVVE